MRTILVGYDDAPPSERALARAIELVRAFDAKLIVTSVAPVMVSGARGGAVDPADSPERHHAELAKARSEVEAEGITARYVDAVGHPAESIVKVADDNSADLIVVGTRAPGFMEHLLGQSTSESVARHSHTDVLIVH